MSKGHFTAAAYEAAFNLKLSPRFKRFLEKERMRYDGRMAQLPSYRDPIEVWFDGAALESFVNDDWPDFDDDGNPYGHPEATEIEFTGPLAGWVPLATLGDEEPQILLCEASDAQCAVGMWEHETDEVYRIASSLDGFLASLTEN